jgi:hypothetical protein
MASPDQLILDEVALIAIRELELRGIRALTNRIAREPLVGIARRQDLYLRGAAVDNQTVAVISDGVHWTGMIKDVVYGQAMAIDQELQAWSRDGAAYFEIEAGPEVYETEGGIGMDLIITLWAALPRPPFSTQAPPGSADEILYG